MKKFVFLIVFSLLAVFLFAQNVSDFDVQGNDDGTMTILNYKGTVKDIVIPETIFNMSVTRLKEGSFKNKGLTSVVIPKTVSFIGNETFRQNQMFGWNDGGAFTNNGNFDLYYVNNQMRAGSYTFANSNWTYAP